MQFFPLVPLRFLSFGFTQFDNISVLYWFFFFLHVCISQTLGFTELFRYVNCFSSDLEKHKDYFLTIFLPHFYSLFSPELLLHVQLFSLDPWRYVNFFQLYLCFSNEVFQWMSLYPDIFTECLCSVSEFFIYSIVRFYSTISSWLFL